MNNSKLLNFDSFANATFQSVSWTFFGFFLVALVEIVALFFYLYRDNHKERIDRAIFWFFGVFLIFFVALRPIGIARDDFGYLKILNNMCADANCSSIKPIARDYFWYYTVGLGHNLGPESMLRVGMVLSAFGTGIKLVIIDKLCQQRILALLLFLPLCYVQYDVTQMRAGLAIAWFLLGVFFVVKSNIFAAALFLFSNAFAHLQGVFSPGVLFYKIFGARRYVLSLIIIFFLVLIWCRWYPGEQILKGLGFTSHYIPYKSDFSGVSIFPLGYVLVLLYGSFLCETNQVASQKLVEIVSASLFVAISLSWLFTLLPVVQNRIFEFYAVPLVLLAGNVGSSRLKITLTCLLALILYLRLELLHDWILG